MTTQAGISVDDRLARTRWRGGRWVSAVLMGVLLLGLSAAPARAHVRFSFGLGVPFYSYPYAPAYRYPYAPYPYGYSAYLPYAPYVSFGVAPRVWGPGYRRHYGWGHGYRGHRRGYWR